jgi:hypothetical protein
LVKPTSPTIAGFTRCSSRSPGLRHSHRYNDRLANVPSLGIRPSLGWTQHTRRDRRTARVWWSTCRHSAIRRQRPYESKSGSSQRGRPTGRRITRAGWAFQPHRARSAGSVTTASDVLCRTTLHAPPPHTNRHTPPPARPLIVPGVEDACLTDPTQMGCHTRAVHPPTAAIVCAHDRVGNNRTRSGIALG